MKTDPSPRQNHGPSDITSIGKRMAPCFPLLVSFALLACEQQSTPTPQAESEASGKQPNSGQIPKPKRESQSFSIALFEAARKQTDSKKRSDLLQEIKIAIGSLESLDGLSGLDIPSLTTEEKSVFFAGLALHFEKVRGLKGRPKAVIEETLKLLSTPDDRATFLSVCSGYSASEIWAMIPDYFSKLGKDGSGKVRNQAIRIMARENGDQALALVLALPEGAERAGVLRNGLEVYFASNPAGAQSWTEGNKNRLIPLEMDAVMAALSKHLAETNDFGNAKQQLEAIKDPEIQKTARRAVWTTQRTILRKEMKRDPATTMNAIVTDQSSFGKYWIEDGMEAWLEQDPKGADAWYKAQWDAMTPDKSQFIAAAFARQSVQLGDLETAKKWLEHIDDPGTKKRVAARISAGK